jgi:hypothetical protein
VSPGTRCLLYHNLELALQSFESQRAVMYDPAFQDFFIQYTDGMGHKNGVTYNEGGDPGDQFFVSAFASKDRHPPSPPPGRPHLSRPKRCPHSGISATPPPAT